MSARENVSKNQFHMHLYHGTGSDQAKDIMEHGLMENGIASTPYLTNDPDLAEYYAGMGTGDPVVIKVRANPRNLRADYRSFEDPVHPNYVGHPTNTYTFDEEKVKGTRDWKNSLRESGAVYHQGPIPPEDILGVE